MVAPRDQQLGWKSLIWPWASKHFNTFYKEGNFLNISGHIRENFCLKHCLYLLWMYIIQKIFAFLMFNSTDKVITTFLGQGSNV